MPQQLSQREKLFIVLLFASFLILGGGGYFVGKLINKQDPTAAPNPEVVNREEVVHKGSGKEEKAASGELKELEQAITQLKEGVPEDTEQALLLAQTVRSGLDGMNKAVQSFETLFTDEIRNQLESSNPDESLEKKVEILRQLNPKAPLAFEGKKSLEEIKNAYVELSRIDDTSKAAEANDDLKSSKEESMEKLEEFQLALKKLEEAEESAIPLLFQNVKQMHEGARKIVEPLVFKTLGHETLEEFYNEAITKQLESAEPDNGKVEKHVKLLRHLNPKASMTF